MHGRLFTKEASRQTLNFDTLEVYATDACRDLTVPSCYPPSIPYSLPRSYFAMSRFFRPAGDSDSESESSEEELMSSEDEAPKPAAKPAMSRFLRSQGDSSSDESSEEESEEESEMSEEAQEEKKKSRFLRTEEDESESDEDVKRVVKSARDKRLEEMEATGKVMDNALKINDWVAISNGAFHFQAKMGCRLSGI